MSLLERFRKARRHPANRCSVMPQFVCAKWPNHPSYVTSRGALGGIGHAGRCRAADAGRGLRIAGLGVRRALGGRSTRPNVLLRWHVARPVAPGRRVRRQPAAGRRSRAGVGLPGRVWESGRPAWIPDVVADSNFPRAARPIASACTARLHSRSCRGGDVLGVMEFFSRDIRQPDAALLDTMMTVGQLRSDCTSQRKWAADELELFFTAVAGPVVRRDPRRLLPPSESRLGTRVRLRRCDAQGDRRSSTSSIPTIGPPRSKPCRC